LLWSYPLGDPTHAGPVIDPVDGIVYTGSEGLRVFAFRPDGPLKWAVALPYKQMHWKPVQLFLDGDLSESASDRGQLPSRPRSPP
jgi:hypothetical protein